MKYLTIGYRLPQFLSSVLFGNRKKYGLIIQDNDYSWRKYSGNFMTYHNAAYKDKSIGERVNRAGYEVLKNEDLTGKTVLEIGPGKLTHISFWKGKPAKVILADVRQEPLDVSAEVLEAHHIKVEKILLTSSTLPLDKESVDIAFSFYNLEHLYPLDPYLDEIWRVLKTSGALMGAIPCEGGLAWGLGRFFTTRRYFRKQTDIDYDKVICWEHPNFADLILKTLDNSGIKSKVTFWPLRIPSIDINLVASFIYNKKE